MPQLSVNINKIALIRNSRGGNLPDLLDMSQMVLDAGVAGITVHPRPDIRHIRPQDVRELRELLNNYPIDSRCSMPELNIEGNPFHVSNPENDYPGFLKLVKDTCPEQVTLVPDNSYQLTSDHGWNLTQDHLRLSPVIQYLKQNHPNLRISLFVSPDINADDLKLAAKMGADRVELYTDAYAKDYEANRLKEGVTPYLEAGKRALEVGLEVNAGHALSLDNLSYLVENLPFIKEVSIGHALICEALKSGLIPIVKKYLKILNHSG